MKKLLSLLLAALLLLSSLALADTTLKDGESESRDASLDVPELGPMVSVEVKWGALEFAYTQAGWNPSTFTSSDVTAITPVNGSNYVELTNYSNVPVTATCSLSAMPVGVTGSVDGGGESVDVSLAACTDGASAPTHSFTVTFVPESAFDAENFSGNLATVTVSVKAAQ